MASIYSSPMDPIERGKELLTKFSGICENIKGVVLRLRKLDELSSRREVSKSVFQSLRGEYMSQLLKIVEEYFEIRFKLEDLRINVITELERLRLEIESMPEIKPYDYTSGRYPPEAIQLQSKIRNLKQKQDELNDILLKINQSLSEDLDIDVKIFIASCYIERNIENKNNVKNKDFIKHFLNSITEIWFSQKDELLREMSELEREASELEERLKELWVRFMVGEY
ncbi:MAG: hypothetical protein RMJ00_04830, partial [Nitrososphaerota archaeon]|nr:hypothetical protein [Candidatus Bathyarchaeota archaeon]MDW8062005.1 hypothetical protein [Nitrososphaerota archaeon]